MDNNLGKHRKGPCKSALNELVQSCDSRASSYWRSPQELEHAGARPGEFPGGLPLSFSAAPEPEDSRRDFLALMGFTIGAASLAGCRAPVQNAVPLLTGSDQIIPGVSRWYATTCGGCPSECSLLVKQRDGRPIKIEGNDQSDLFRGGTCAVGQATVLSLYDSERLRGPLCKGQPASWQAVDEQVVESLRAAERTGHRIVLLSRTISSPSTLEIIAQWSKRFPTFRHIVYDSVSVDALRTANAESFGRSIVPHYSFDRAQVIVGLEADFLGTWLSPVEFANQYARSRDPNAHPSFHVQFESGLSVTGSNADLRLSVAPSEIGLIAVELLRRIAPKAGLPEIPSGAPSIADLKTLDAVAERLWRHWGESLVVSGVQDKSVQVVVNAVNALLGNIGKAVDLTAPSLQRGGEDQAMADLVDQMDRGEIHTLILYGVNPGYDYADGERFIAGMRKVPLSVSFSDRREETSSFVIANCPDHHFLEAWGDAEPVQSHFSLSQPLIAPLFNTRAAQESLLRWLGNDPDYYSFLRSVWQKNLFPRQKQATSFGKFWDESLQTGVRILSLESRHEQSEFRGDWKTAVEKILQEFNETREGPADRYELHLYESVALRDGHHANNPWLQELPDPISKVTWGNYAAIAPSQARKLELKEGDVVSLKTDQGRIELPVFLQPGQHERTISVALGYGRKEGGKVARAVGANAFPLAALSGGFRRYSARNVILEKTGKHDQIASTQTQFSMEGRPIVLETTLEELRTEGQGRGEGRQGLPTLWEDRPGGKHSWGMVVDLNACTGCSACVVACQAENNVPVVGKDQVQRIRIMHWIRIDRYYSGSESNPSSVHQPMMCQHCGHAPCETVCPVDATTTSSEGINQQVYNRCIGTRYCANNCPYKVRRFNWYNYTGGDARFDFYMANPLGRMILNPDVVVRSRGVMEKCSFCIQRIQLAKNTALQQERDLGDGDIETACQQACPTKAIVFGDLKNPESRVSRLSRDQRYYQVLTELGTRPSVGYLKRVRNTTKI
jgi:Fe-S-cluster-containing dehydrogenase component/anaerobic selenocysteine-containing dehydrogenase